MKMIGSVVLLVIRCFCNLRLFMFDICMLRIRYVIWLVCCVGW